MDDSGGGVRLGVVVSVMGCDRQVSKTSSTSESSDGTVKSKEKTVTQTPDGTVTKTEASKTTAPEK